MGVISLIAGVSAATLTGDTMQNSIINNYIGLNRLDMYLLNSGPALVNTGCRNTIRGDWFNPARH
jgi:hypothetical protein